VLQRLLPGVLQCVFRTRDDSIIMCCRVLQGVTMCVAVKCDLHNTATRDDSMKMCYNVLQGVAGCCRVLCGAGYRVGVCVCVCVWVCVCICV